MERGKGRKGTGEKAGRKEKGVGGWDGVYILLQILLYFQLTSIVFKIFRLEFESPAFRTRVVYAMLVQTTLTKELSTPPMLPGLNSHLSTLQAFQVISWIHQKPIIAFSSTVHLFVTTITMDTPLL